MVVEASSSKTVDASGVDGHLSALTVNCFFTWLVVLASGLGTAESQAMAEDEEEEAVIKRKLAAPSRDAVPSVASASCH